MAYVWSRLRLGTSGRRWHVMLRWHGPGRNQTNGTIDAYAQVVQLGALRAPVMAIAMAVVAGSGDGPERRGP